MKVLCWIVLTYIAIATLLGITIGINELHNNTYVKQEVKEVYIQTMVATAPIPYPTPMPEHPRQEQAVERKVIRDKQVSRSLEESRVIPPEEVKPAYSQEDLHWLAKIVFAEAEGESEEGQIAVANVVLNRVKSGKFPDTIKGVIFAYGINSSGRKVYQFSPIDDGRINLEPDATAIECARRALEGERASGMPDNIYYFYMPTEGNRGDWIRTREVWKKIGCHRFCY